MNFISRTFVLLGTSLVLSFPVQAREPAWPRLEGETGHPECKQALLYADSVFRSQKENVAAPHVPPKEASSRMVLGWFERYLVDTDPEIFSELKPEDPSKSHLTVYWQREPASGYRLAMVNNGHNWRGDNHTLYVVDRSLAFADFANVLDTQQDAGIEEASIPAGVRTPNIYRRQSDGLLWALTLGSRHIPLDSWDVHVPDTRGLRKACTVRFRPDFEHAVELLPAAVRRLAVSLDQAIGSGRIQGTEYHTNILRERVHLAWTNATQRPWATTHPYNRRAIVDRELETWARRAANRRLLNTIKRQYQPALSALAGHYRKTFGLSPAAARTQARFVLDAAYRSHFVFSQEEQDEGKHVAAPNPWPQAPATPE